MYDSSLLQILKTFNSDELKKFDEFVSSPYFNKKSAAISLYRHIKKYAPGFVSAKLERMKVWSALYPDKDYNYGIFKNLVFDLTKLAEKFITFEYFQKDELEINYDFLDALNERELRKLFKHKFDVAVKKIESLKKKRKIPVENYFYINSKLYLLKFGFSSAFDRHSRMEEELNVHAISMLSNFLIQIFKTYSNIKAFSNDFNYKSENNPVENFFDNKNSGSLICDILDSLKMQSKENYFAINLYYKFFKAVADENSTEKYLQFKNTLLADSHRLAKADKYIFYTGISNCLSNIKATSINKSRENFDLIKAQIKDGVILNQDGLLEASSFISFIQTACNIGDAEFIMEFTKGFINKLPKELQENLKKYSLAHFYFTKKEFEKSLEIISTIHYDIFIMKYYLRNLQMMICYEMNDYNSFLSLSDSFKHFLSKNKEITESWKSRQSEFDNFLNRLFKLKENFDEYEASKLRDEIASSLVSKKQWLLSKARGGGEYE